MYSFDLLLLESNIEDSDLRGLRHHRVVIGILSLYQVLMSNLISLYAIHWVTRIPCCHIPKFDK